jgi:ketosteroid isomerase-like protein
MSQISEVDKRAQDSFEVIELNSDFRRAVKERDRTALESMVADEYVFVNPAGYRMNKRQMIEDIMVRIGFSSYDEMDLYVHIHGNTAESISFFKMQGRINSRTMGGHYRNTHTYVKRETGKWQLVSSRLTLLQ